MTKKFGKSGLYFGDSDSEDEEEAKKAKTVLQQDKKEETRQERQARFDDEDEIRMQKEAEYSALLMRKYAQVAEKPSQQVSEAAATQAFIKKEENVVEK